MEAREKRAIEAESCGGQDWIEEELAASTLPDARLDKRLRSLVEQLAKGVGRSIPFACQDWAAAKAAYRFFSNGRVSEEQILADHFLATRERVACGEESGTQLGLSTRKRNDLERINPPCRHPTGRHAGSATCG
jgi:hypothetical protein